MSLRPCWLPAIAALLLPVASANAQDAGPAPTAPAAAQLAYLTNPKFQKAVEQASDRKATFSDRLDSWKKAEKLAAGQCMNCFRQILTIELRQGQYKDAAKDAATMASAATDPDDQYFAASRHAHAAYLLLSEKPKPDQLNQVNALYEAALALRPSAGMNFDDGRVLAMMGKFDDARARFKAYLDIAGPKDPYRTRAEHFIENPKLAALKMAPAFTIHTVQGDEFSLDSMQGKVVLLDFWASWCGPCRETLPEVKRVVQQFAGQPLVVVSISVDHDEAAWKKAMQEEGMTWPQYRDADGTLSTAYGAQSIPRFFTIDTDGALQSIQVGTDADIVGSLRKLVKRAQDAQRLQALASDRPAAGQ